MACEVHAFIARRIRPVRLDELSLPVVVELFGHRSVRCTAWSSLDRGASPRARRSRAALSPHRGQQAFLAVTPPRHRRGMTDAPPHGEYEQIARSLAISPSLGQHDRQVVIDSLRRLAAIDKARRRASVAGTAGLTLEG